jgi:ERCC4-type nuclease
MKIIFDIREVELYNKCVSIELNNTQKSTPIILSKETLIVGDILIKSNDDENILLIERKSFSDLIASIKDGRYEEQSYRLLNSSGFRPHSIIYLLEGMFSQVRTPIDKKIIYSSMTSLQYFKGFCVHRTSTVHESSEWILSVANKLEKELDKGKLPYYKTEPYMKYNVNNTIIDNDNNNNNNNDNDINNIPNTLTSSDYCNVVKKVKKDNISPDNIGEIILCQIPGISSITAIAIMKHFDNFSHFMVELQNNTNCLFGITTEHNGKIRKISKSSIDSIYRFLVQRVEISV